jgi:hypothetical protein
VLIAIDAGQRALREAARREIRIGARLEVDEREHQSIAASSTCARVIAFPIRRPRPFPRALEFAIAHQVDEARFERVEIGLGVGRRRGAELAIQTPHGRRIEEEVVAGVRGAVDAAASSRTSSISCRIAPRRSNGSRVHAPEVAPLVRSKPPCAGAPSAVFVDVARRDPRLVRRSDRRTPRADVRGRLKPGREGLVEHARACPSSARETADRRRPRPDARAAGRRQKP